MAPNVRTLLWAGMLLIMLVVLMLMHPAAAAAAEGEEFDEASGYSTLSKESSIFNRFTEEESAPVNHTGAHADGGRARVEPAFSSILTLNADSGTVLPNLHSTTDNHTGKSLDDPNVGTEPSPLVPLVANSGLASSWNHPSPSITQAESRPSSTFQSLSKYHPPLTPTQSSFSPAMSYLFPLDSLPPSLSPSTYNSPLLTGSNPASYHFLFEIKSNGIDHLSANKLTTKEHFHELTSTREDVQTLSKKAYKLTTALIAPSETTSLLPYPKSGGLAREDKSIPPAMFLKTEHGRAATVFSMLINNVAYSVTVATANRLFPFDGDVHVSEKLFNSIPSLGNVNSFASTGRSPEYFWQPIVTTKVSDPSFPTSNHPLFSKRAMKSAPYTVKAQAAVGEPTSFQSKELTDAFSADIATHPTPVLSVIVSRMSFVKETSSRNSQGDQLSEFPKQSKDDTTTVGFYVSSRDTTSTQFESMPPRKLHLTSLSITDSPKSPKLTSLSSSTAYHIDPLASVLPSIPLSLGSAAREDQTTISSSQRSHVTLPTTPLYNKDDLTSLWRYTVTRTRNHYTTKTFLFTLGEAMVKSHKSSPLPPIVHNTLTKVPLSDGTKNVPVTSITRDPNMTLSFSDSDIPGNTNESMDEHNALQSTYWLRHLTLNLPNTVRATGSIETQFRKPPLKSTVQSNVIQYNNSHSTELPGNELATEKKTTSPFKAIPFSWKVWSTEPPSRQSLYVSSMSGINGKAPLGMTVTLSPLFSHLITSRALFSTEQQRSHFLEDASQSAQAAFQEEKSSKISERSFRTLALPTDSTLFHSILLSNGSNLSSETKTENLYISNASITVSQSIHSSSNTATIPAWSRGFITPHVSFTSPMPVVVTSSDRMSTSSLHLSRNDFGAKSASSLIAEESTKDALSTAGMSFNSTSRSVGAVENLSSSNATQMENATKPNRTKLPSTDVASTAATRTTQDSVTTSILPLSGFTTIAVALTTGVQRTTKTTTTSQPRSKSEMKTSVKNGLIPKTSTATLTSTSFTTTQTMKTTKAGTTTVTPYSFFSTSESPPIDCNITKTVWVKTVLTVHMRRNRLDNALKQNLPRGLTQALQKAFNSSSVYAQVENLTSGSNVTVGYSVISGRTVYIASVVVETLNEYGVDKLLADIKQFVPLVQSLPIPVSPWKQSPAIYLQLKTVLRFVGPGEDIKSCAFAQMMERRLESAFTEAQFKVLNSHSRLSVQILRCSRSSGSPAVSLIYMVRNSSTVLNGTISSSLLNQLTAELVGYFLLFPPLIIAEPLEYHNLNTSVTTRDFWVITVIQDVDNSSLEGNYQSFASLMEQRLAEVFVIASQQGTRFRRATTVGSYTVQMVSIRRVPGVKNPAELTYYVQLSGFPLPGTTAAKILSTVDSQTMALTLGFFIQLQAEPVVKNPPNNQWIIAAILAPIAVVTVIIIIITAVLCRKNKGDFKTDAMGNLNPRAKTAYRREASYYHQPVQGFDYAKQHLGQQGADEESLPVTQETLVLPLTIRDAPLSQERGIHQDSGTGKKTLSSEIRKSRLPSEDGSVISNESGKLNSSRVLSAPKKVPTQQKMTKEEARKKNDPYDTSSGSLQLISVKPMTAPPSYPASSDRSQDSAILNGEVSMALKQKSDIEHYRNKLRLKAKKKGYYDFPATEANAKSSAQRQRHGHGREKAQMELSRVPDPDEERASTYVKSRRRHSQQRHLTYRSRQSLNSPSPGGTEMDLLVMRERPRRGIRNSGYDTEPELMEETNVDRLVGHRICGVGRQVKVHSDTSTLSSQPSINEVRQQMHLLLEEAFSLASAGHSTSGRHHHHLHGPYNPGQPMPYSEVVTSAPGTMTRGRGALQWVPAYRHDMYQCSLPKPAFRFTQLPDMAMGSPPPPIPPRTGPTSGASLRQSTPDMGHKARNTESPVPEMQNQRESSSYMPLPRVPHTAVTSDQPVSNFSGNPMSAVYAIPTSRPDYPGYFVSTPPTSYRSPSWMSYPPEPEDVPPQWADSMPLPGYVEAFPHPRYPEGSPHRLPRQYSQASSTQSALDNPPTPSTAASQQSLTGTVHTPDTSLSNICTAALVKAIREEVAKLAKKQTDMFEFQV